jgi:hypothetical protein
MYQPRRISFDGGSGALRTRSKALVGAASLRSVVRAEPAAIAIPYNPETVRLDSGAAIQARSLVRSPRRLLLVAILLGLSVDVLFYAKPLGISAPLFALLVVGSLFMLGRLEGLRPVVRNLWLLAPLFFFATMVFFRANAFLTLLNVTATLALLALVTYFYANDHVDRLGLFGFPAVPIVVAGRSLTEAAHVVPGSVNMGAVRRRGLAPAAPVIRGLVLALPVVLVFTVLLSSADAIFARYVGDVLSFKVLSVTPEFGLRGLLVLTSAWVLTGGLAYALERGHQAAKSQAGQQTTLGKVPRARRLGAVEAATVLVMVNILFMVFVVFQFTYLFGGQAAATMEDSVYRHYARRGFGELMVVSVLVLALILGLRWLVRHDRPRQSRIFNLLSTHLVLMTFVILASAWTRMLSWEAVADYIYTDKRLYVRVFIVWLAITLFWFLATLWTRPGRFAIGVFVAALGFLATLNVIDPDVDVVQYNVDRAYTRPIYMPQLARLSDDAVPLMVQALDTLPADTQADLRELLRHRLERMERDPSWRAWPSFHLARTQAYDILARNRDRLK